METKKTRQKKSTQCPTNSPTTTTNPTVAPVPSVDPANLHPSSFQNPFLFSSSFLEYSLLYHFFRHTKISNANAINGAKHVVVNATTLPLDKLGNLSIERVIACNTCSIFTLLLHISTPITIPFVVTNETPFCNGILFLL